MNCVWNSQTRWSLCLWVCKCFTEHTQSFIVLFSPDVELSHIKSDIFHKHPPTQKLLQIICTGKFPLSGILQCKIIRSSTECANWWIVKYDIVMEFGAWCIVLQCCTTWLWHCLFYQWNVFQIIYCLKYQHHGCAPCNRYALHFPAGSRTAFERCSTTGCNTV